MKPHLKLAEFNLLSKHCLLNCRNSTGSWLKKHQLMYMYSGSESLHKMFCIFPHTVNTTTVATILEKKSVTERSFSAAEMHVSKQMIKAAASQDVIMPVQKANVITTLRPPKS